MMRRIRQAMRAAMMEFLAIWLVIAVLYMARFNQTPASKDLPLAGTPSESTQIEGNEIVIQTPLRQSPAPKARAEYVEEKLESSAVRISSVLSRQFDRFLDDLF